MSGLKFLENLALGVCSILAISSVTIHFTSEDKQKGIETTILFTNGAVGSGVLAMALGRFNRKKLEDNQDKLLFQQKQQILAQQTELKQITQSLSVQQDLSSALDKSNNQFSKQISDLNILFSENSNAITNIRRKQEKIFPSLNELNEVVKKFVNVESSTDEKILEIANHFVLFQEKINKFQQKINTVFEIRSTLKDYQTNLTAQEEKINEFQAELLSLKNQTTTNIENLTVNLQDISQKIEESFNTENIRVNKYIEESLEKYVNQTNQLLSQIQPHYKYELIYDKVGARAILFEALEKAEQKLIFVCPWISQYGTDKQVFKLLRQFLKKGGIVEIAFTDDPSKQHYQGVKDIKKLSQEEYNCNLIIIDTHEKYLVCDNKFAMLGSHNFLYSDDKKYNFQKEIGIKTDDPAIINNLIQRFYNMTAKYGKNYISPESEVNDSIYFDDIPF